MTLEQHRRKQAEEARLKAQNDNNGTEEEDLTRALALTRFQPDSRHRRSSSAPSHEYAGRRKRRSFDSDSDSSSDETIMLPDRFDSHGQPIDRRTSPRGWTSRRGDFEYRPKHANDWDVKGSWQVAGTDQEMVNNIVRNVTGILEGRRENWIGLLGNVLGRLEGARQRRIDDDDHDQGGRQRKYRRHLR